MKLKFIFLIFIFNSNHVYSISIAAQANILSSNLQLHHAYNNVLDLIQVHLVLWHCCHVMCIAGDNISKNYHCKKGQQLWLLLSRGALYTQKWCAQNNTIALYRKEYNHNEYNYISYPLHALRMNFTTFSQDFTTFPLDMIMYNVRIYAELGYSCIPVATACNGGFQMDLNHTIYFHSICPFGIYLAVVQYSSSKWSLVLSFRIESSV